MIMRRRRDERGATAIIAAISALTLFAIAAMAVDLGNAFARQRSVQASADFAALSGGQFLPGAASSSDPAVQAVADYLNKNAPQNDGTAPSCTYNSALGTWSGGTCVTPGQLIDGDYSNGEVVFSNGGDYMTVYTPQAKVDFGLANAIGFNHVNLVKSATVGVFSKGGALPFYTSITCSWNQPQIIDTSNGQAKKNPPAAPTFITSSKAPAASGLAITDVLVNGTSIAPPVDSIDVANGPDPNTNTYSITITLTAPDNISNYSYVGFDTDNSSGGGAHEETPIPAGSSGTSVTVPVPLNVLNTAGYWFVRLYKPSNPHSGWTDNLVSLGIDNVAWVAGCGAGSNDGNFGSLLIPRDDTSGGGVGAELALNTILGPEFQLTYYPGSPADPSSAPTPCNGQPGAVTVFSPPATSPEVNCVQTDTGNPQTATNGFVSGETNSAGFQPGLLDASQSGAGTTCGATNDGTKGTTNDSLSLKGTSYSINNDVLTCYFNPSDTSLTVADVSSKTFDPSGWTTYPGGSVISKDIMNSPRFVYIPVLAADPGTGKKYWPIVDFRAAFITGQIASATLLNPDPDGSLMAGNAHNGFTWDTTKGLQTLSVVMINDKALPSTATWSGKVQAYLGSGIKVVRLIN